MYFGRHGGGWQVYVKKDNLRENEVVASEYARRNTDAHLENFIECVRSRKKPNADVEEIHLSMVICHLANISYRVGNRKLRFDGKTETFINDPEANKYLKANYRHPWVVPEKV